MIRILTGILQSTVLLSLSTFLALPSASWAIDDPSVLTTPPEVREAKPAPKMARMRMRVKIVPFQKYVVKDRFGKVENVFKPVTPIQHNLRARIDHPNHFYIDQWHIESVPVSWQRDSQKIKLQLRLFKLYGKHKSLEQMIGSMDVEGTLVGENYLYNFSGSAKGKFSNVLGDPLMEIEISDPGKISEEVATSADPGQKIKESF